MTAPAGAVARGGRVEEALSRFGPVAVVLSPPRCASTALAFSLWQHRVFRWYVHEPFDRAYHQSLPMESSAEALGCPLDRAGGGGPRAAGEGVVVKEMTFQAGPATAELVGAATLPVVLAVRDPRLAVLSRARQLAAGGGRAAFTLAEAGWRAFGDARRLLGALGLDYVIVDTGDVRREPQRMMRALTERLGLEWDEVVLSWPRLGETRLGNLGDQQALWYERVLSSTGFEPPVEPLPSPGELRAAGVSEIVEQSLDEWARAREDAHFVGAGREARPAGGGRHR
jgi:hypothetical protein